LITGLNTKKNTYAFGMAMPGRSYQSSISYRYGMNGQEKDLEIFEGAMTAEFWEYDTRLGRRWNLDPKSTVGVGDYACFLDNPIEYADPNGDKVRFDNAKAFFKVIGKAITDKTFRQQLIAQHKATRTTTQTNYDSEGNERSTDVTHKQYFHYRYNKQSENSLQEGADNLDDENTRRDEKGVHSSANRLDVAFSNNSETFKSVGAGGIGLENQGPKDASSKQMYKSGTITIDQAGSNTGTPDRMTIYHGATQLSTMLLPVDGGVVNVVTVPFSSSKSAKIRVVFSNDDNKKKDPGAYGAIITITRP
jgi:hypothetical protein